jgi:hypothetical protein
MSAPRQLNTAAATGLLYGAFHCLVQKGGVSLIKKLLKGPPFSWNVITARIY